MTTLRLDAPQLFGKRLVLLKETRITPVKGELVDDSAAMPSKKLPPTQLPLGTSPWHPLDNERVSREGWEDAWGMSSQHLPLTDFAGQPPLRPLRVTPGGFFKKYQPSCCSSRYSKRKLFTFGLIFGLLITCIIAVILTLYVHQQNVSETFDGTLGPRGGRPSPPQGRPLPVLGVLNLDSKGSSQNQSVYVGTSIDWVWN